jgi:hypothetical protein
MLVRTQSLALLAGVVLVLLWRRKWAGAAVVVACAFVVLLPWQRWVAHYAALIPAELSGKYGAYNAWVAEGVRTRGPRIFADAIAHNTGIAFRVIRGMFSLPGIPGGAVLFTIVLLPPAVAGAIRLARQAPVLLAALCVHALLILVFPYDAQRYVWGSWPFITIWLAAGFVEIESRTRALPSGDAGGTRRHDAIRMLAGACVALVLVSALATTLISVSLGSFRNIAAFGARQLTPMVAWAGANAPADAVIASDDETAVYLYTGRRAVPLSVPLASWHLRTDSASPVALEEIMRRYHPTLVMARWTASVNAALRLTQGAAPVLVPVAQLQNGFVFARVPRDSTR